MEPSPADPKDLLYWLGIAASVVGAVIASFWKGIRSPDKPERRVIEAASIVDTIALATRIVADIKPELQNLARSGADRDRKIDEALEKLERLERKEEVAREAREEVARQLEMRERRHPAE